jgi:probable rRNA maturation factor
MPGDNLTIDAVDAGGDWSGVFGPADFDALASALGAETGAAGEVALALGDDAFVRDLNARFRGKDKPTNVLSFPAQDTGFLGDVALARETLAREADEQGKQQRDHALHLLVHGILHLLGYDHETDDQATIMEDLERRVLARLELSDPYGDEPHAHA